jgi:DNA-directed RNA polymerase specialized sigma24 family protein
VDAVEPGLVPEYAEWLDRVTATYQAVSYTCRVRLGDSAAAETVAARVATGLVARPAVFRHWGLPFSGRIAKLAEDAIADARAGRAGHVVAWAPFRRALASVPPEAQTTFVLTCVEGLDDEQVARRCGCDTATAGRRRASVLDHMRALAAGHGGHVGTSDER